MYKKAKGLSMKIIRIAAIALLILVILAVIFIGRMKTTTSGIDQCKGTCVASSYDCTQQGSYYKTTNDPCYTSSGKKDTDKPICCVGV